MKFDTILTNIDHRGVLRVMLNRPEKHNALSAKMIAELSEAARIFGESTDVRVIVIEATGKSFCAGGDLNWMREQMNASREVRVTEARKLAEMLRILNTVPKPVIAKIDGNAFGGGVGVISVCDLAYCSKDVTFGLTETKLGLIPATISPYVLAKIGEGNARRVIMSARSFNAEEAFDLGLVSKPVEDTEYAVEKEIAAFLKASPRAVADAKALARSLGPIIDARVIDETIQRLAETWETPDALEGVSAFFEKRKPNWV